MTAQNPDRVDRAQYRPNGMRVLLHAAALRAVAVSCRALGEIFGRLVAWVTVHVCNLESQWFDRATAYDQRAYQVVQPWSESAEQPAGRRRV